MKSVPRLVLLVIGLCHAIVLLHAAEALIDAIEWPDVEVLDPAPELTPLVEKIGRYAADHELGVFLENERYAKRHPRLDRDLTVS